MLQVDSLVNALPIIFIVFISVFLFFLFIAAIKSWLSKSALLGFFVMLMGFSGTSLFSYHLMSEQTVIVEPLQHQIALFSARQDRYEQQQNDLDEKFSHLRQMAEQHALISVSTLTDSRINDVGEAETAIQIREQLVEYLHVMESKGSFIQGIEEKINQSVHEFLFERFSRELIAGIGRAKYGQFINRRDRTEWTDQLFIQEIQPFLKESQLMNPVIEEFLLAVTYFEVNKNLKLSDGAEEENSKDSTDQKTKPNP